MPVYCEQPPPDTLARWVECGWYLESDQAIGGYHVPPDGCLDILYDRRTGLRAIGTMTVAQSFHFPEGACAAGIRFRPGMAGPFLGVSPAELTNGSVALEDLWSRRAREVSRQLDDAVAIRDAMRILLGSLRPPEAAPNPVQEAVRAMTAAHGDVDLEVVALQANLSPRQFRRRCLEETGLTPKLLCRILRFRRACDAAHAAARPNWSAIALEAEYFDQAHLIRDFQEFTGRTPVAVFSNTRTEEPG